jgi:hypothetical protein
MPVSVATHVGAPVAVAQAASTPNPDDWNSYQNGAVYVQKANGLYGHAGFNAQEALPQGTQSNPGLQLNTQWPTPVPNGPHEVMASGAISSQPVVATVNGTPVIYWGSWDGYEHATVASSGANFWPSSQQPFVGMFAPPASQGCQLPTTGPASAATMTSLLDTQGNPLLVVVGNNPKSNTPPPPMTFWPSVPTLYGIDAVTGAIVWEVTLAPTGQMPDPNSFGWAAPAVYSSTDSLNITHWQAYVGLSSFNDCPLVQGQVQEVSFTPTSAVVVGTGFDVVPANPDPSLTCVGGGVWSSPTVVPRFANDPTPNIWVSTGNAGNGDPTYGNSSTCGSNQLTGLRNKTVQSCMYPQTNPYGNSIEPYAQAVLELDGNLNIQPTPVIGCYQETAEYTNDDFGSTLTFFTGYQGSPPVAIYLVGALNKDGFFYVFNQAGFITTASPLFSFSAAQQSSNTNRNIATAAWDPENNYLYVGTGAPSSGCATNAVGALYVYDLSQVPVNGPFNLRTEVCFQNQSGTPNPLGNSDVLGAGGGRSRQCPAEHRPPGGSGRGPVAGPG